MPPVSKTPSLDSMLAADGELTAADQSTDRGPAGAATEAAVLELGALVRGHLELAADEAEPRLAGMWDLLERQLDRDANAALEAVAAPLGPAVTRPAAAAGSWFAGVLAWLSGHRSHLATGLVSAGAVAALALALRPEPPAATERVVVKTVYAPIQPTAALAPTPPEVESLDVAGGTGTVFTVTDEDGETAVIWVEADDPADVTEGI